MIFFFLSAQGHPVGKQLHTGLVGIDRYFGHVLHPVHIPLSADMDERLLAEPGFVGIERILLVFAVDGNQALMILSILSALTPGVAAKVKHIPDMGCPDKFPGEKLSDQILMVFGLVFLGIISLLGVRTVPVQAFCTVFRTAHRDLGIYGVEFIKPGAIHVRFAPVPAEVMVVRNRIRNPQILGIHGTIGQSCQRGQSGFVQLVAQIIEQSVIFQQVRVLRAVHGNFVAQPPHHNAGMVVILNNQLPHLIQGILPSARHMPGDVRNLCPNNQSPLIAQIIKIGIVLIVGQPDGGGTQFANQVHVLPVMLRQQGVSHFPAVLMAADTPQRIFFSIQNESPLRINGKGAAAKAGADAVQNRFAFQQFRRTAVQVRVLFSLPQMGVLNPEICGSAAFEGSQFLSFSIGQRITHCLLRFPVGKEHLYPDSGVLPFHNRGNLNPRPSIVVQIEVRTGHTDQVDIPVQSSVEGKVRHLGINLVIGAVVHQNSQQIFLLQRIGKIHAPGGKPTIMMTQVLTVQKNIRRGICTVDLQIVPFRLGKLPLAQRFDVAAGTPIIVTTAVLSVNAIPGVGKIDEIPQFRHFRRRLGHAFCKGPLPIEIVYRTHREPPVVIFSIVSHFLS